MAVKNLQSLGLLRNGKVYPSKQLAYQAFEQGTNDGVAKLARYLDESLGGEPIIRTLVGFYANAEEMTDASGGTSSYTIIDIDGSAAEVEQIKQQIDEINEIIGEGIDSKTLTEAIEEINATFGTGFTTAHTVADALKEVSDALIEALTIGIIESSGSSEYSKVYTITQGDDVVGTINIPKDIVIKEGKLVHGYWSGDTFTEDEEGPDVAIKLVLNNDDVIYINAKDLVDVYTAGNGIKIENNEVSIKLDSDGEAFLTVGENGLKLYGVQAAIDSAIEAAKLEEGDGISIESNKINAVAAEYSATGINNPITVDEDGIKFANILDCGFFDN